MFLGHIVGADGLRVDPSKIAIVKAWPVPRDKTLLQNSGVLPTISGSSSWVGQALYLQLLLKKDDSFEWNDQCDASSADIKHALCNAPVLALPDLNRPFEVIRLCRHGSTGE